MNMGPLCTSPPPSSSDELGAIHRRGAYHLGRLVRAADGQPCYRAIEQRHSPTLSDTTFMTDAEI